VQVPGFPNNPLDGRGGGADLAHGQVGGCLDDGRLDAGAAVAVQAHPDGPRRIFFTLAGLAEIMIGAGSVTPVTALVEVQLFRLEPVPNEREGYGRLAENLLAGPGVTSRRMRAYLAPVHH
jgi:hypothetical protein